MTESDESVEATRPVKPSTREQIASKVTRGRLSTPLGYSLRRDLDGMHYGVVSSMMQNAVVLGIEQWENEREARERDAFFRD